MTANQAAIIYAALPRPVAESIRQGFPDIGEGIAAQFLELYDRPTPDAAERLAANLQGAAQVVARYVAHLGARHEP